LDLRGSRLEWSGENYKMRDLMICTAHCKFLGDKIGKNEMGWKCSVCGEKLACAGFWWGNLRETNHLGVPG
jgi:hypothetical protein